VGAVSTRTLLKLNGFEAILAKPRNGLTIASTVAETSYGRPERGGRGSGVQRRGGTREEEQRMKKN